MAASLSKALARRSVTMPSARRLPDVRVPGAEDLGNMFQFNAEFSDEYCAARDLGASRKLNPDLHTFDKWLEENVAKIPLD